MITCRSVRSGISPARPKPTTEVSANPVAFAPCRCLSPSTPEMNYASTRITALKLSEVREPSDRSPDTYAEFLLRTSLLIPGVSLHEPPARCR